MAVDIVEMDDLKHILKDTVTAICRSRLHSAMQLSVEVSNLSLVRVTTISDIMLDFYVHYD